ncbi:rhodanese-like domain-containing protein [Brunnivagina elsteri]|uniref:Rhodanese n=1 Tax=Brunnivagina elsteri CCALA 953 TaxID=987040 RepID=A0A2A2TPX9_9CYAN|nr:rhodanese-like domain-containing protein [Calothrix elsteri]PAX60467.1 rhodanese [Calothrix elsteri CCALA 953]
MSNKLFDGIIPKEPPVHAQSDAHTVKSRLEWGEPAFTILDVRSSGTSVLETHKAYNQCHIMGAMPMPIDELVDLAQSSLQKNRDIYVYAENDQQANQAAQMLRNTGFTNVSNLRGGLAAWKAIAGPVEGTHTMTPPGADDYNVVSRIKNHLETQQKEV